MNMEKEANINIGNEKQKTRPTSRHLTNTKKID
jgi:hypothetical protein